MDERPPVWIGHVVLNVSDLDRSSEFWSAIGMRPVEANEQVSIFELRGGTHLVLIKGAPAPGDAPFDLMVEDVAAAREAMSARGLGPSPMEHGRIHDAFTLTDPDGYVVTVNSTHVIGPV